MGGNVRMSQLFLVMALMVNAAAFSASEAQATTPFLYNPYYGNYPGANARFDHKYPNYPSPDDGVFVGNDGVTKSPPVCSTYCYSGHSGIDYAMSFVPVVASEAGTVEFAGWASTDHESSYGLMTRLRHANTLQTVYGHLSMARYATGNEIGRWQIGTSGNSGNSTGPHLHFEVRISQAGTYKVTDPFKWTATSADPWVTAGGPVSEWLWVSNPVQAAPVYSDTSVTDDAHSTFSKGCSATSCPYWYNLSLGYSNHAYFTYTRVGTPNYWAKWSTPALPSTGQYEVEVYIPVWDVGNNTHAARYEITYNGGTKVVVVDQHEVTGSGQWISLGRYNFTASSGGPQVAEATTANEYVMVKDVAYTNENQYSNTVYNDSGKRLIVDAVRWRKTH